MSTLYRTLVRAGVFLAIFLLAPAVAAAHERWFVPNWQEYPPQFGLLLTPPVLLCIALACAGIGILLGIRVLVGGDNRFPQVGFLRYYDRSNQIILAIQTAIGLIAVAVNLDLFAPNLNVGRSAFGVGLVAVEVFVAFTFISGLLTRIGALALMAVFICTAFFYPIWNVLEQTLYVGIALYLLIVGRGLVRPGPHQEPLSFFARYWRLAPLFLRLGVGFSLAWVAFTEKLLDPRLAEAFLKLHPTFNVAQLLGLTWFTNDRYILAAGAVELTIGLALMSGILPKIVIFGMFVPFNLTLPFLPPAELLGHLPIFAAMYVLLFLPPQEEQMIDGTETMNHPEVEVPRSEKGPAQEAPAVS